ncbi:MAG: hypothetical protein HOP18_21800 [Deltaproteobacteria bacterium]|nr:hypothetical protein [Deltaproteobacteria bacterium]
MNYSRGKLSLRSFCFSVALLALCTGAREATAAQLSLSWGDASSNEDGFKIERKIGTTGTYAQVATTAVNTTAYPDTTLANSTQYCYRVKAYNTAGDSGYSNEACGTTPTASFALTVAKSGTGQGTVTSSPAGISCGTDCSESYTSSTSVTLSATPTAGSTFGGWSGGGCSGTGTCTLLMNTATTVTATFTATVTYPLTVTTVGSGTVTSSPAGISCGADCSESYANGTVVALTATPASGYTFSGWSNACTGTGACSVTLNAAKTATATFTATPTTNYTLTVTKVGTGTVTSSPAGISCGTDCSEPYANNTVVALTATPATGFTFSAWSGSCTGTGACSVTLNAAKTVTVTFVATPTTGLVAAYSFGAGTGTTAKDSSGLNNVGTLSGATWTTAGRFGAALSFNGVNNFVTVNDAAALDLTTGMTLEAWVYPTAAMNGWRGIVQKEASGAIVYYLHANSAANRPATGLLVGSEKQLQGTAQVPVNTWTHLAATYDGVTQRLYVNGVQVSSRAQTGPVGVSGSPLRIGGNSVWGEYFQGRIDEVRVYNRALTAAQIATDMNTAVTP